MAPVPWKSPRFEQRGTLVLLALCWLVCFASTMTEPVNRDEHMYLSAASLLGEHRLYADFAFLQTPYSVWVYRAVTLVTPGDWVLLPARLLKTLVTAGMILMLFALLKRLGARSLLAAILAILLFQDALVRDMAGLARNYDFAQMAILGAFLLLPFHLDDRSGRLRLLAVGALATTAAGFKLTYAPLSVLALAWPLFMGIGDRKRVLAWVWLGGLLGLLPLVVSLTGVDIRAVRFNLLDYHYINAEFHALEGYRPHATILDRATQAWGLLLAQEHWPLTGITLLSLGLGLDSWRRSGARSPGARKNRTVTLAWLFIAAAGVMAVAPRPLQTSYLAPVFYGLTMVIAAHAGRLSTGRGHALVVVCGLASVIGVLIHLGDARDLGNAALKPSGWTGVQVHRSGQELAEIVQAEESRPIATTHPIYVLEAGLPLYPELGAAEFAWRSGSLLSPEQRKLYSVASSETLDALFRDRPPGAILIETKAPWDGPLEIWAQDQDWRQIAPADSMLLIWAP